MCKLVQIFSTHFGNTAAYQLADQLISRLDSDCARPRLHHWLSAKLDSPQRSSLPSRRCSCLKQSATARHFCAFSSRLCISAENPLLLRFLSKTVLNVQCLWSDLVIIRHSNRSSYSLTYLHINVWAERQVAEHWLSVEFYLYPTVGTVLIHSAKPELTE